MAGTYRTGIKLSRRDFLRKGASTVAALGVSGALLSARPLLSRAAGKYEGVTLRVLSQAGVAYEPALKQFAQEFSAQTGATVLFDWQPWESLIAKVQADVTSGRPQYDIFCNDIEFQYTIYPYLLPLNDLIEQSGYDMDDFFEPVHKYGQGLMGQEGVRYGLPVRMGVPLVMYRTDLMDGVPATWEAYEEVLEEHTGNGRYGLSFAGVPAQLVKLFLARYWSQGVPLMTPDWEPLINGPEGVQAAEMLKRHKEKYAPPGVLGWDNPDAANAFVAGDTAVYEGWGSFILPKLNDPAESRVVNRWDIGLYPEGGTGNLTQHHAVILKTTRSPEAAFDFIAYCTDRQAAKRLALEFDEEPARLSAYGDPDVLKEKPYLEQSAKAINRGKPFTPSTPYWLQLFISLAEGLSAVLAGERTPEAAMDSVANEWSRLGRQYPMDFPYAE